MQNGSTSPVTYREFEVTCCACSNTTPPVAFLTSRIRTSVKSSAIASMKVDWSINPIGRVWLALVGVGQGLAGS